MAQTVTELFRLLKPFIQRQINEAVGGGRGQRPGYAASDVARKSSSLAQFAATTSAELAGVLSDETGYSAGALAVFSISPVLTTPNLGTPSAVMLTNATGLPTAGLVDAAVTLAKMANLAQDQFIGRTTASTGVPETATITAAARTVLDDVSVAAMLTTLGVTAAAQTVLDDATVSAMVDTLGGASSVGTGGLARATSPVFATQISTPAIVAPAALTIMPAAGSGIGFGISSPATKFHFYDTASLVARFEANGSALFSGFQVQADSAAVHLNAQTFGSAFAGNQFGIARAGTSSLFSDGSLFTFGTKTAHDLIIGTSNVERMRILSTGNVVIGATSALGKLDTRQASTTAAIPTLYLQQADVSEEFFEFGTTIGVGNAIEAVGAKTLTTTHFIKVTIPGGLTRYLPIGTIA